MPTDLLRRADSDPTLLIVIVSIVGGVAAICAIMAGVVAITRIATRHRERMARIGMGLDPDGEGPLSGLPADGSSPANASQGAWDRSAVPRPQSRQA